MSEAGSQVSSGTICRGLQIIKENAPKNVYRPSTRGHSAGKVRGQHEAAAKAVPGRGYEKPPAPTRVAGRGVDKFHGGNRNKAGHHGSQGRLNEIPFDQTSHAEGDVSIPSVYSEPDYDIYGEDDDAHDVSQGSAQGNNGYNYRVWDNYRRHGNQGQGLGPWDREQRNEGHNYPMIEEISHLTKGVGVIILGDILPGGMMTGTLIDPMFLLKIPSCQSMMGKFLGEHMRLS